MAREKEEWMHKLVRWIFTFVTAVLFVYACGQYWIVRQNISDAQVRLTELYETSDQLRRETEALFYQIDRSTRAGTDGEGAADTVSDSIPKAMDTANG